MSAEKETTNNPAGRIMTTVGGILGFVGVVAWLIGLKISLTPQMQEILFYKGLFAASFGLMAVGAIVGRRINAERKAEEQRALNEGAPAFEGTREREDETRIL